MNKHVIFLSAVAALFFSCTRETDLELIQPGETITFTAGWAGAEDSRTILQSDGTSVWWDAAEQINVFFGDKASGVFSSTNAQPQAIVDFQGTLPIIVGSVEAENPAHAYWAVYPYNAANACDGESVTVTVPAVQTAMAGTFANKMFPSIATSTNFYLAFYNVCGGARFTVFNEGITSVTFKANDGESLAGKVQVGFDDAPVIRNVLVSGSEVRVDAPEGGFVPGQYYFVSLLPQTLSKGMSLTFRTSDGKVATTSLDNSITVTRSRFGTLNEKDKGLTFVDESGSHEPTDAIFFADSNLKGKLVAAFDTNGDGELSYEEAAAVTSGADLKAAFSGDKSFESFDEYQYFTGITRIEDSTFAQWNQLKSIIIPESVTRIRSGAFLGCSSLTGIRIPEGVTYINGSVFQNCSSLESVEILGNITGISTRAFAGCSSLSSINIPSDTRTIGSYAFQDCASLSSLTLPESVTVIGAYAFSWSGLSSIDLGSITNVYEGVFQGCLNLVSVTVPESVTTIGNSAFAWCESLTSIVLPGHLTGIGESAFSGAGLLSIVIPETVTRIGDGAFQNCGALSAITVEAVEPPTGAPYMFSDTNDPTIYVPAESIDAYKTADYWKDYASRIQPIPVFTATELFVTAQPVTIQLADHTFYRVPLLKTLEIRDDGGNRVLSNGQWLVGNGRNGIPQGVSAEEFYEISTDFSYNAGRELSRMLSLDYSDTWELVFDYTTEIEMHGTAEIQVSWSIHTSLGNFSCNTGITIQGVQ